MSQNNLWNWSCFPQVFSFSDAVFTAVATVWSTTCPHTVFSTVRGQWLYMPRLLHRFRSANQWSFQTNASHFGVKGSIAVSAKAGGHRSRTLTLAAVVTIEVG